MPSPYRSAAASGRRRTRRPLPASAAGAVALLVAAAALVVPVRPAAAAPAGQLAAWGEGANGQLGYGGVASSVPAVSVEASGALAGRAIVQVAAGGAHACAVSADGRLACWGDNGSGQLGTGTAPIDATEPTTVGGGSLAGRRVVQVSAGTDHTCAVTADGRLSCWGGNAYGQLGTGSRRGSLIPVLVDANGALRGRRVTQVSAGSYGTCAVAAGAAYCWGLNTYGQVGDGSTVARLVPTAVRRTANLASQTVAEVSLGTGHACARTTVGGLACWGWNDRGQLGVPGTTTCASTSCSPVPVGVAAGRNGAGSGALARRNVAQVSAGFRTTCAATVSGGAVCWGWNGAGQLGTGDTVSRPVPAPVATPPGGALTGLRVTEVRTSATWTNPGPGSACARASDGTVACWGVALDGGLGTETDTRCGALPCLTTPFALTGTPGSGVLAGASASAVAVGQHFGVTLGASVTVTSPAPDSTISSGGYYTVRFTTDGVPARATAYLLLNGRVKAKLALAPGVPRAFTRIPAETGNYAVRIGGGDSGPQLALSAPYRLTIIPFRLDGSTVSGSNRTFRVLTGNFAAGTPITLTRDGTAAATRVMPAGSAGEPGTITITVPDRPGTYQVRVQSPQGFVYGEERGVITVT